MNFKIPYFQKETELYTSCDTLPLGIFIKIINGASTELLIKSGKAAKEQTDSVWSDIISEYAQLSNTSEYQAGMKTMQEYGLLKARYLTVVMALKVLNLKYDAECVEVLKRAGYNYEFSKDDPAKLYIDLDLVKKKSKTIQIQLEQKAKELEYMEKSMPKADEKTWIDNIATISKFMGYRIDTNVVTVSEYVGYQRQLSAYNEQINAKNATAGTDK